MMAKIQQATSTADKIQLGLVNSTSAGFSRRGDRRRVGLLGQFPVVADVHDCADLDQLAYQTATNGTTAGANIGSVVTLTASHWYQFNRLFHQHRSTARRIIWPAA